MSAARLAMRMMETKIMFRREFIVPLACLNFRIIFAQERRTAPWNPLLKSTAMTQHRPFRYVLFAVLGLIAGFLALAIAVPLEPQVIAPVIALFSPGLSWQNLLLQSLANLSHGRLAGSSASPSLRTVFSTSQFSRCLLTLWAVAGLSRSDRSPSKGLRTRCTGH